MCIKSYLIESYKNVSYRWMPCIVSYREISVSLQLYSPGAVIGCPPLQYLSPWVCDPVHVPTWMGDMRKSNFVYFHDNKSNLDLIITYYILLGSDSNKVLALRFPNWGSILVWATPLQFGGMLRKAV